MVSSVIRCKTMEPLLTSFGDHRDDTYRGRVAALPEARRALSRRGHPDRGAGQDGRPDHRGEGSSQRPLTPRGAIISRFRV